MELYHQKQTQLCRGGYVANKRNHWPSVRFCERFQIQTQCTLASDLEAHVTGGGATKDFSFFPLNIRPLSICYPIVQLFDCLQIPLCFCGAVENLAKAFLHELPSTPVRGYTRAVYWLHRHKRCPLAIEPYSVHS